MNKYKIIIDGYIQKVTPELLADIFDSMHADEQVLFFNRLGENSEKYSFPMQMQYLTDDKELTLSGRRVMQYIGEYSHWGLVPKASDFK